VSPGISMSMPALAEAAVLWVPPQSEVMKPSKPNWLFRMLFRYVFSQA